MSSDEHFMLVALDVAQKAKGYTSPNPMVGAVIVRDEKILATGYHKRAGTPHAEIEALKNLQSSAEGATMYVNLEPCVHTGRTGPCTTEIIKAKLNRVVIGVKDPNPKVNGQGIKKLREHGLDVSVGILERESRALNASFFSCIEKGRPFISLKMAISLDSKIAIHSKSPTKLSSSEAQEWTHQMRAHHDSIIVGSQTVSADNPRLNVRFAKGLDPLRVVLDSQLSTPLTSDIYQPPLSQETIVFCLDNVKNNQRQALQKQGVRVKSAPPDRHGRICLHFVLKELKKLDCLNVLVEGGGQIQSSFLQEKLADQVCCIVTPWILGEGTVPAFPIQHRASLSEAISLHLLDVQRLGPDILMKYEPKWFDCASKE